MACNGIICMQIQRYSTGNKPWAPCNHPSASLEGELRESHPNVAKGPMHPAIETNADDTRFRLQGFLPVWIVSSFGNAAQARHRDVAGRQRKVYLSSLAGGTAVSLERMWVRFIDKFSSGHEDAALTDSLPGYFEAS
nr:uncharacterized protein LOC112284994 [Physcomitrium patens]|eukprot:XP_024381189.1 uncharacterized protein LOC112284994 [Physcomitrella patens]